MPWQEMLETANESHWIPLPSVECKRGKKKPQAAPESVRNIRPG